MRITLTALVVLSFMSFSLLSTPAWGQPPAQTVSLLLIGTLPQADASDEPFGPVTAVVFDPDGSLFFLEEAGKSLVHVSSEGVSLGRKGGFGFGQSGFHNPTDLTISSFELWVADPAGTKILRFDRRLAFLGLLNIPHTGEVSSLNERPVSVARAASGDVFILEEEQGNILLLNTSGELLEVLDSFGEMRAGMTEPRRIEISADGKLAVADPGAGAVHLFDRFGNYRNSLPWPLAGRGPLGLDWRGEELWVCGEEGLVLFGTGLHLQNQWSLESLGGPLFDVAVQGDHIALALAGSIRIYRISSSED